MLTTDKILYIMIKIALWAINESENHLVPPSEVYHIDHRCYQLGRQGR